VEKVLVAAWTEHPRPKADKLRLRLFMLMHRKFRSFELARILNSGSRVKKLSIRSRGRRGGKEGRRFGALLHRLPAKEREALALVGACNFSYADAGLICGCDTATMMRRVESACEHLSDETAPPQARAKQQQQTWRSRNLTLSDIEHFAG
jgi:hypothetical protein